MAELKIKDAKMKRLLSTMHKRLEKFDKKARDYTAAISSPIFRNLISHFEDAPRGTSGGTVGQFVWPAWSQVYAEHMERLGKGGNKLLQDTGRLRQAFLPANQKSKVVSEGILFLNETPYAGAHDEGTEDIPKRPFMWTDDATMETVGQITLAFVLGAD